MALSDIVVGISGNAQGFMKTLGGVTGGLRGLQTAATKVASGMKMAFGGITAALGPLGSIAGIFSLFSEGTELAKTQIAAEKKLGAVLESTGHAAGISAEEIKGLASARQGLTNFGDEATIDAAAILATFKEIKGDEFRQAIPLIQDMAAVMGSDLNGAALQLGKAINDPIAGLGALSRVGVQFTHDQKEMIKGLVETGQLAKAQGIIMAELKSEFGGAAEAMADPLTQASNAWGDFKEQLGMIWNDIKAAALEAFGFGDVMAASGNMAADFREKWLPSIKGVLTSVGNIFSSVVSFLKSQWDSWVGDTVKEIFFVAENWQLFGKIAWEELKLFVSNGIERVKTFFTNFRELMGWLGANWPKLMLDMGNFLVTATKNMAANVGTFFKSVLDFARGKGFKPKFVTLSDGFKSSLEDLPNFTEAAVRESTAELDKLMAEAAKRRIEFEKRFGPQDGNQDGLSPEAFAARVNEGLPSAVKSSDFKSNNSIETGTKEAFEKIFRAIGGGNDKKKPEKETADNTQEIAATLKETQRLWERVEKKLRREQIIEFVG